MRQECSRKRFRQGSADISRLSFALYADGETPQPFAGAQMTIDRFAPDGAKALVFASDWGREMTPAWRVAAGTELLVTSGRACKGYAPWIFLREKSGCWRFYGLETFGNWRFALTQDGEAVFSYDPEMLSGTLAPGERISLGGALCARAEDFDTLCGAVCRFLRDTLPKTRMDPAIVSWNHWWRYEDCEITEEIVLQNAQLAKEMGIDLIVLDAGWFGVPDEEADWTKLRGDWDKVNRARFPHGLPWLADRIHGMGLKFGLWLEPEGMGERSALRKEHPEWEARRSDGALAQPYLCLGARGAKDWLLEQIKTLVSRTQADYLKLDFNVDPGLGCDRGDHGHQPGMGLWAHMRNYTSLLDELREEFPGLIIENCSSGGLRLDLTMLAHTDMSFLSDPDESAHSLQVFLWLSFLPPERLLHWAWSQTREYPDGSHAFSALDHEALAKHAGAAMLHPFGFSRDLTQMSPAQREAIAGMIARYRQDIAPKIKEGRVRLLSPPPLRKARADDGRCVSFAGEDCACVLESKEGAMRLDFSAEGTKIQYSYHPSNQEESET